jgi:hypothetical protein
MVGNGGTMITAEQIAAFHAYIQANPPQRCVWTDVSPDISREQLAAALARIEEPTMDDDKAYLAVNGREYDVPFTTAELDGMAVRIPLDRQCDIELLRDGNVVWRSWSDDDE